MGLDLDQISASLVLHNRFLSSGEGTDLVRKSHYYYPFARMATLINANKTHEISTTEAIHTELITLQSIFCLDCHQLCVLAPDGYWKCISITHIVTVLYWMPQEFCQMSYINTICCQPTGLLTKTKQDMEIHPLRAFFTAWLLWDLTFLFLVAWKYQVLKKVFIFLAHYLL